MRNVCRLRSDIKEVQLISLLILITEAWREPKLQQSVISDAQEVVLNKSKYLKPKSIRDSLGMRATFSC